MKISEVIEVLKKYQDNVGDIPVALMNKSQDFIKINRVNAINLHTGPCPNIGKINNMLRKNAESSIDPQYNDFYVLLEVIN